MWVTTEPQTPEGCTHRWNRTALSAGDLQAASRCSKKTRQNSTSLADSASEKSTACIAGKCVDLFEEASIPWRVHAMSCRQQRAAPLVAPRTQQRHLLGPPAHLENRRRQCLGSNHRGHQAGKVCQPPNLHACQLFQLVPNAELRRMRDKASAAQQRGWLVVRRGWDEARASRRLLRSAA